MKDQAKTKELLIGELAELRRRVAELEAVETGRKQAEEALQSTLAELTVIQQNVPIAMMLVDRERRVRKVNEAAALFAGRPGEEMLGLRGGEALRCLHHLDDPQGCGFGPACATCAVRLAVLDTFATRESRRDVEAWLSLPRGDSVEERCLLVSTAHLQMDDTEQVLVCAQDVTDRKRVENIMQARLRLLEFASSHSTDELLTATLNEVEALTGSSIGFYHFLEADQRTLSLQNWSTNTLETMCTAEGKGSHYDVAQAGVWVDCVHERRPVIHNDYASLPHRKGMPEGHAPVVREVVVPIFRGELIEAIIGVGNKPTPYSESDVEIVSQLGDLSWDITERKRTEEALQEQFSTLRSIIDSANALIFSVDRQYRYTSFNEEHAAVMQALYGAEIETGHSLLDYMTVPEDRETARGNLDRALAGEQLVEEAYSGEELRSRRYFRVSHSPIKTEDGQVIGVAVLAHDMTERKRAEREIEERRLYLEGVLEAAPDAIVTLDARHRVVEWNAGAETLFGYSQEEVIGQNIDDLITSPDALEKAIGFTQRVLSGKDLPPVETVRYRKDGSPVDVIVAGSPILVGDELIGVVGIYTDITARKRAEEELIRLSSAVRMSTDSIVISDIEGKIVDVNQATLKMYGTDDKGDLIGKSAFDLLALGDRETAFADMAEVMEKGYIKSREYRIVTKNGGILPVEMSIAIMKDADGKPIGFVGVSRDITERKRAEETLRESEQKFRSIIESSSEGFTLVDEQGAIIEWNPAREKMTGLLASQVIGQKLWDVQYQMVLPELRTPELYNRFKQSLSNALQTGQSPLFDNVIEAEVMHPRRPSQFIQQTIFPIETNKGYRIGSVTREITERKRAEEAVRDSEARYRAIVEAFDGLIYVCSQDYRVEFLNKQLLERTGYDGTGELCYKVLHDLDSVCPWCVNDRVFAGETVRWEVQSPKDNRWYYVVNTPIHHTDGSMSKQAMILDITERKWAEEALRCSEEKYRALVENLSEVIFTLDAQGRFTYISPAIEQYTGYRTDEVIGQPFTCFIHPDDLLSLVAGFERSLAGQPEPYEFRVHSKDGTVRHVHTSSRTLVEEGQVAGLTGIMSDITQRKQAEAALRESERKWRSLYENLPGGSFIVNDHYIIEDVNDILCTLTGFMREELVGQLCGIICPKGPHKCPIFDLGKERIDNDETAVKTKDGQFVPIIKSARRISIGAKEGIVENFQDITEMVRAEEALRESEQKYRFITEKMADAVWLMDMDFKPTFISPSVTRMFGYTLEELQALSLNELLTPESFEFAMKTIATELSPERLAPRPYERSVTVELEFRRKDGSPSWTESTLTLLRDSEGCPIGLMGVGRDITERKRAEEALRESEERYRALYEDNPSMYFTVDAQGTVLSANPFGADQLGYAVEELIGQSVLNVFYPDDREAVQQQLAVCLEHSGEVGYWELRKVRQDGSMLWVREAARAVQGGDGRPVVLIVCEDITERKRAEEERERLLAQIQEQAHRIQEVVDTVPEGVLLLDSDRRVVLTNPLGQKDLAALAGAQVGDILTRLGDRSLAELLTSPPKGLWHEVATKSRNFQVIARPVEDDATPKDWVLVVRDVTQQYESERRIQQQERLAAVGQLAAGIAHDFNNIMAVIVLHAQMGARSAALSDRDRGRLATINEQAQHATRLIQQILDFSRRAVLERQPLDLLPLLKEQVQLLERTLPEHIAIRLDYGHGEYTVNADPTRMQQMVMNLAVNARDAMPEGGVLSIALERITVEPGASLPLPELVAGDWIRLSMADTGVGVLPEVLLHIFEPFYTTKPPDRGSGLGLAQVYGIVAQHEGHIDVETQVGAGTTFVIYLPALAVPPTTPLSPDVSIVPRGKGEVVLVVEDNAALRATLRETLAAWGYQVREAADGVQALALLEELGGAVDLVLSDVVMPVMGGVALVHALRERGWVMPVILLSGYPQKQDLAKLRAHGVSAWLPKPPSMEELAEVVAQALGTD